MRVSKVPDPPMWDDEHRTVGRRGHAQGDAPEERRARGQALSARADDDHLGAQVVGDADELVPWCTTAGEALDPQRRVTHSKKRRCVLESYCELWRRVAVQRLARPIPIGMTSATFAPSSAASSAARSSARSAAGLKSVPTRNHRSRSMRQGYGDNPVPPSNHQSMRVRSALDARTAMRSLDADLAPASRTSSALGPSHDA